MKDNLQVLRFALELGACLCSQISAIDTHGEYSVSCHKSDNGKLAVVIEHCIGDVREKYSELRNEKGELTHIFVGRYENDQRVLAYDKNSYESDDPLDDELNKFCIGIQRCSSDDRHRRDVEKNPTDSCFLLGNRQIGNAIFVKFCENGNVEFAPLSTADKVSKFVIATSGCIMFSDINPKKKIFPNLEIDCDRFFVGNSDDSHVKSRPELLVNNLSVKANFAHIINRGDLIVNSHAVFDISNLLLLNKKGFFFTKGDVNIHAGGVSIVKDGKFKASEASILVAENFCEDGKNAVLDVTGNLNLRAKSVEVKSNFTVGQMASIEAVEYVNFSSLVKNGALNLKSKSVNIGVNFNVDQKVSIEATESANLGSIVKTVGALNLRANHMHINSKFDADGIEFIAPCINMLGDQKITARYAHIEALDNMYVEALFNAEKLELSSPHVHISNGQIISSSNPESYMKFRTLKVDAKRRDSGIHLDKGRVESIWDKNEFSSLELERQSNNRTSFIYADRLYFGGNALLNGYISVQSDCVLENSKESSVSKDSIQFGKNANVRLKGIELVNSPHLAGQQSGKRSQKDKKRARRSGRFESDEY